MKAVFEFYGLVVIGYFATLNLLYVAFTALAWHSITRYLGAREYAATDEAFASPMAPPISVLLPAFKQATDAFPRLIQLVLVKARHRLVNRDPAFQAGLLFARRNTPVPSDEGPV